MENYDTYLEDDLLPAQRQYADFLEANDTWHEHLTTEEINQMLATFRNAACMNDPTMFSIEVIERNPPEWLWLYVDTTSVFAAQYQDLSYITDPFCFRDRHNRRRILACNIPPWSRRNWKGHLARAFQAKGCREITANSFRRALLVPRTDCFQLEESLNHLQEFGGQCWSRAVPDKFDVLAVTAVRGIS